MAANIDSMFYHGAVPWHGLGTKLEHAATAAEAIAAAGLSWEVKQEPIFLAGSSTPLDGYKANVRGDNRALLGVVGDVYRPLQNKESFSFFDAVVGEKLAIYHTAGALGNGSRVWILAKLPGELRVIGDDITEKYLLLTNTHDGTSAVNIMFTPIRVVCQNTLNVALRDNSRRQSIRHTASMGLRVADVRDGLGIINARFSVFEEAARALCAVQVNAAGWRSYLGAVGVIPAEEASLTLGARRMSTRASNIMDEVSDLFEHGKGNNLPGVRGTAWAAFNAVAEYVDYRRTARGGVSPAAARAASLLFGSGADLKQKAWDQALALTGAR